MQGIRAHRLLALAGLFPLGIGCFSPPPEAQERLEQVRRQGEEFDAALDQIEDRLLGTRARVGLWEEMAVRHRNVSEVACENVAGHVAEMEKHLKSQAKKSRALRRQRTYEASPHLSTTSSAGPKDEDSLGN